MKLFIPQTLLDQRVDLPSRGHLAVAATDDAGTPMRREFSAKDKIATMAGDGARKGPTACGHLAAATCSRSIRFTLAALAHQLVEMLPNVSRLGRRVRQRDGFVECHASLFIAPELHQ